MYQSTLLHIKRSLRRTRVRSILYSALILVSLSLLPYYNYSQVADKHSTNKVYRANEMQRSYCLGFLIPLLRCYNYEAYDNNAAFSANACDVYSLQYGGEFSRYRMNVLEEKSIRKFTTTYEQ